MSISFWCMQSTHMASQQITEEAVYLCTGNPLPKDIEQISYWLLNESFTESFKRIHHTPLFFFNILLLLKLATFLYKFLFPHPLIYLFLCFNFDRNIWNEDKERIGLGRYCERGDNVSAVHYARCPLLILFIWFHLHCIVLTGLFSRSKCHRIFEFS